MFEKCNLNLIILIDPSYTNDNDVLLLLYDVNKRIMLILDFKLAPVFMLHTLEVVWKYFVNLDYLGIW